MCLQLNTDVTNITRSHIKYCIWYLHHFITTISIIIHLKMDGNKNDKDIP